MFDILYLLKGTLTKTLKLHLSIFFLSTIKHKMTVCNVKGFACNDEPAENFHPIFAIKTL